jgi:SAM-dependent methyltransferase
MLRRVVNALRDKLPHSRDRDKLAPSFDMVPSPINYTPDVDVRAAFWNMTEKRLPASVLEVGTLQAVPGRSTHHRSAFPGVLDSDYVRLDTTEGADVDVVGNLHALPASWSERFDCFIAVAVFEHLERPWLAAKEVARSLSPGGIFFVSTHQCFPLHGYPSDFFRFSRDALRLIFEDADLIVDAVDYEHRCSIVPPEIIVPKAHIQDWNTTFPSFVLVNVTGHKPG